MSRASKKLPLQGWYVISTRPLSQHGGVRSSAAKSGARTFALSTVRLLPLPAKSSLRKVLRCPRVIVTSPAAARLAHAQFELAARPGQRWFALGAGTAAALRRCGIARIEIPASGSDSEALLRHDDLRALRGEQVGVITAPGGRGLLATELQARGANLVIAEVYRRQPVPIASARLRALAALPSSTAVLLTSGEAFSLLRQALDAAGQARLSQRCCVVASDRLAAQAKSFGFALVLRANDVRPRSLLAALANHVGERRFR